MILTPQQQEVLNKIQEFMKSDASVFILKGYAGTGKTTMLKFIVDEISPTRAVVLMAPTGRAARVLGKKTGHNTSTIHRAIYGKCCITAKPVKDVAESEFKICFPINIIDDQVVAIIDEASMVSSRTATQELFQFGTDNLMNDLITYVRPQFGGKLIFVGDPAQLPPVGDVESAALNAAFFERLGLKTMETELTEVLRQKGDSLILKNAMQIRDLLREEKRTRLVFDEKEGEVVNLQPGKFLTTVFENYDKKEESDSVVICFSNRAATEYNQEIRAHLFQCPNPPLQVGDMLMVVQNNYTNDVMNGDFVRVLQLGDVETLSAPVYVVENGTRLRKVIQMNFQQVEVEIPGTTPFAALILLNVLYSPYAALDYNLHKALYINFCMRHPSLRPGSAEFQETLHNDVYYNCLKAKYGYAVTGHKCQGGEWAKVFVDYSGRTGLSTDCLRWAYTATTRARDLLYISNLPHITPFSQFRIEAVQRCSAINEECRILKDVPKSPFHNANAPDFLHAKYGCIAQNMEYTPYHVSAVESKPYQEIYYIWTPDGAERYDIRYKKGGLFSKAVPLHPSSHSVMVCMLLDAERTMPYHYEYTPSNEIYEQLRNFIQAACDTLDIAITNIVEQKDYSVNYYLYTSNTNAYIKVYVNAKGFVSYAKPMSLLGNEDEKLNALIEVLQTNFQ